MRVAVKSFQPDDYYEIQEEVDQLNWLLKEFRTHCKEARIDAWDTLGHTHKCWEWARALKGIKETLFNRNSYKILSIGAAYDLLGPSLSYLGYEVTEAEPDGNCGAERQKLNQFLTRFNNNPIHWIQKGFGDLKGLSKFDVVMSISTVEHIDLWLEKACWKEMTDLLSPKGTLIVTTDVMPEAKKGFQFDDCRWSNYSMEIIKERVEELKSYGLTPVGKEDYKYYGAYIHDYSFAFLIMVKK